MTTRDAGDRQHSETIKNVPGGKPPADPESTPASTPAPTSVSTRAPASGSTVRINPTTWNAAFGFDQGQLRTMPTELLTIAGQGPVDEEGALLHEGDICAQLSLTMRNIDTVLGAAGMTFADVTRMIIYTTDMDGTLASYDAIVEQLAPVGATPPATLIGVSRFAIPGMAVEIDVTAAG